MRGAAGLAVLLTVAAACAPGPAAPTVPTATVAARTTPPTVSPTPTALSAAPTPSGTPTLSPAVYAAQLVTETNAARDAEGLAELGTSACAMQAAAERAQALVGHVELTHAPLDGVARACGVARTAENLSRAAAPAADVVAAWLDSPGHRNNLLDPQLREVGITCVDDAGRLLCSQVFLGG